jgi:hypothetical protein
MYAETIEIAVRNLISETMQDGGWTASLTGKSVPASGYMVGGVTDSLIFGADILNAEHEDVVHDMIIRWINQRFDIGTSENMFIGGWVDSEDGKVYIDLSEKFNVKEYALMIAADRGEIAIWDLANSQEIRVTEKEVLV